MRKSLFICLIAFLSSTTHAAVITSDATGTNNFTTTDFWGISFDSGSGFLSSVTFDLSPFGSDFFDFDGSSSYNDSTSPVIGASNGILNSDITSSFVGNHPTVLTFNFALNSFGAGDFFRFSADVDQVVSGSDMTGLLFSVVMENGSSGNGVFSLTGSANQSASTVTTEASSTSVPEPVSIALLGLGLFGIGISRKKKTI